MTGFYGEDLARIHHAGYGDVARAGASTLLGALEEVGVTGGLVVELGSGSGVAARVLTDAGHEVLGFDISAEMVALAREHAPAARFERASVWDVEIPPCSAIASFGEVLSYAADPQAGRAQLATLFARAHAALAPQGVLVFDVMISTGDPAPQVGGREADGWFVWAVSTENPGAATLERRIVAFTREDDARDLYRRTVEVHLVRLYDPGEILDDLAAAGFEARRLHDYAGAPPFRAGVAGFVARKA